MATDLKVGQSVVSSIRFLDQNGQALPTAPVPDSPPQWTQTNPLAETVTASADGLTATSNAISDTAGGSPGVDTLIVSVTVGGRVFEASITHNILPGVAPGPVLTSIEIVDGTPT